LHFGRRRRQFSLHLLPAPVRLEDHRFARGPRQHRARAVDEMGWQRMAPARARARRRSPCRLSRPQRRVLCARARRCSFLRSTSRSSSRSPPTR
jgi:hypothetical protein